MMNYAFYTADVFTNQIFGGNPLAVFPQADSLTPDLMQKIAAEINYSETVFVFPPTTPQGTRRLRIFTPQAELPFAGHPTIGTAFVLAAIAEIPLVDAETTIYLEEGVGLVPVTIHSQAGQPIYSELRAAQLPEFGPEPPAIPLLAELLSLQPAQILTGEYYPQAVSCGLPFLFIPLSDQQALNQARLKLDLWEKFLRDYWASSLYLFTLDSTVPGLDFHARMFAPGLGVPEDPATGSAATALGGYFAQRQVGDGQWVWHGEQGRLMGRPSHLTIKVQQVNQVIQAIAVGGASVLVSQGTMTIP